MIVTLQRMAELLRCEAKRAKARAMLDDAHQQEHMDVIFALDFAASTIERKAKEQKNENRQ